VGISSLDSSKAKPLAAKKKYYGYTWQAEYNPVPAAVQQTTVKTVNELTPYEENSSKICKRYSTKYQLFNSGTCESLHQLGAHNIHLITT
jgi:hypothetical protein